MNVDIIKNSIMAQAGVSLFFHRIKAATELVKSGFSATKPLPTLFLACTGKYFGYAQNLIYEVVEFCRLLQPPPQPQ